MAGKKMSGVYVPWPKPAFNTVVKTNKNFRTNFHMALTYAHQELTATVLKKEVATYLKTLDAKHPLLEKIKDLDEVRLTTIGKYTYVINHGGEVPDDILPGLIPSLEKIINEEDIKTAARLKDGLFSRNEDGQDTGNKGTEKMQPSIQDRLKFKAKEVASELEGWIDEFCLDKTAAAKTVEEFVTLYKANDLKAPHMRHLQSIFSKRAEEISIALVGKDKDLVDAYSNFTKPELKKFDSLHQNLLKACDMFQEVAKVERAPRKKKPVSTEKLVAKLKYKKEDATLGIVSLNPALIIGAKEMWVYNTKTRKLSQYKALDERGLSVKGTGLLCYSTDSVEKTLRKPAETLAEFKKASKVKLRTFLKDLTTVDVPASGKLNEHIVILRIDK